MGKRVTVWIEGDLDKKIRAYQTKQIPKVEGMYSYSKAVNDLVIKELKKL